MIPVPARQVSGRLASHDQSESTNVHLDPTEQLEQDFGVARQSFFVAMRLRSKNDQRSLMATDVLLPPCLYIY